MVALSFSSLLPLPRAYGQRLLQGPLGYRSTSREVLVPRCSCYGSSTTCTAESGVPLWRVLPSLLPAERCDVEVAPGAAHRFVTALVNNYVRNTLSPSRKKHVVAVPLIDTEILVEET